jgi:hypothetical protein
MSSKQRKCFYFTNLQPLWGPDNFSKSSYYMGKLIRRNIGQKHN